MDHCFRLLVRHHLLPALPIAAPGSMTWRKDDRLTTVVWADIGLAGKPETKPRRIDEP